MIEFDFKKLITDTITQAEGKIDSSDDTSINFSKGSTQYKVDFKNNMVFITKIIDGSEVSKFPKIIPLVVAVIRSVITRLN